MPKILLILIAAAVPAFGQTTNSPAAHAPATNAPAAAPPAIAVGDVITSAQTATVQLEQQRVGLNPDVTVQAVGDQLPQITQTIDDRVTADAPLVDGNGSLPALQNSQLAWQGITDNLGSAQQDMADRLKKLNGLLWDLGQQAQQWKATATDAVKANAPAGTLQQIQQLQDLIADTTKLVLADQKQIYQLQNSVGQQEARARVGTERVRTAMENARKRLFEQNRPPLWRGEAIEQPKGGIVAQERLSFGAQVLAVQDYLSAKIGAVVLHVLLFTALAVFFYWLHNTVRARAEETVSLRAALRVFDVPLANALLLALVAGWWLYPDPPNLLWAALGAVALAPAVVIIRRLIEPAYFPVLYATVAFFAVDQVRLVIRPGGFLSRSLLLLELLAVCVFLLAALRSRRIAASAKDATRFEHMARAYFHAAFFVFIAAGFANVLGYILLAVLISGGMLQSSYFALVFYAGVRVVDALALCALCVWPLARSGMVRRHHDLIYRNMSTAIRWGAIALWVVVALHCFSQFDVVYEKVTRILVKEHDFAYLKFDLGSLLAFPVTVWAAFQLSRFIRFCLEEEVYPHLQLGRGIPYAVSTMVHYGVLLVGFVIALDALGLDLTKFTILAGAFGVGLGFGLQNIMNNFMSGLILLFEQPIKVGDTIQLDANTMGKVERIGIRASVILLTNGSEMIVPNGNLISSPVTNWTLSNCERLIEIPVSITSKVDPQHVIELLTKIVAADSRVLKNPPPQALLVTLGATLAFKVRAWIDSEEEWMKITSELSLAINGALAKEGIALG